MDPENARMNERLRRDAGRGSVQPGDDLRHDARMRREIARVALDALGDDATPAQRAAVAAGLPLAAAARLRGDTDEELAIDAADFADALGQIEPPVPPLKPGSFSGGQRADYPRMIGAPTPNDRLRAGMRVLRAAPKEVDVFDEVQIRESRDGWR
jgi:hypothetical protein